MLLTIPERPKILVVCGRNKRRSRTAEYIFKNDRRFSIRSAGLSPKSQRQIKVRDIEWADRILVMEDSQRTRISGTFRHLELPAIDVLYIDDEYEFLDANLITILTDEINLILKSVYNI